MDLSPKIETIESKQEDVKQKLQNLEFLPPTLEQFPEVKGVEKQSLIELKQLYNNFEFEKANILVSSLNLEPKNDLSKNSEQIIEGQKDIQDQIIIEKLKLRIEYWNIKALYNFGLYAEALSKINLRVQALFEKYPDLKNQYKNQQIEESLQELKNKSLLQNQIIFAQNLPQEFDSFEENQDQILIQNIQLDEWLIYIFLKFRVLQAQLSKKVGLCDDADKICYSIFNFVKIFMDQPPKKFWLSAVKASIIQSTQYCNAKEYDSAHRLLENVSNYITKKIQNYFYSKDQECYYNFNHRRIIAQYQMFFYDYKKAEELLRSLLNDQLQSYELTKQSQQKEEEAKIEEGIEEANQINDKNDEKKDKKFQPINLQDILIDKEYQNPEYVVQPSRHPLMKISQTLMLLAEAFAFRLKSAHALEIYDFISKIYFNIFKTKYTVFESYLQQMKSECCLKMAQVRVSQPIKQSQMFAQESIDILEKIHQEQKIESYQSYILIERYQSLGDSLKDDDQFDKSKEIYDKCYTFITIQFGDNHSALIPFIGNLITQSSSLVSSKSADKTITETEIQQIYSQIRHQLQRNLQIALKYLNSDSIHLLYHLSSNFINLFAIGDIKTPTQSQVLIKQMRQIIENFHGGDPRKLSNQIFYQIQLLYAQMLFKADQELGGVQTELLKFAAEIYNFVISSQLQYVKLNTLHPFLEQTYTNIAIYYRTIKKYGESLMMFKKLENLQRDLYGDDNEMIIFTLKNIGICYLGLGQSQQAGIYFNQALDLLVKLPRDDDKLKIKQKDDLEIAALNQNLYLCFIIEKNYTLALECVNKQIDILTAIYGDKSKKLSSKYYQKANTLLYLLKKPEAIAAVKISIQNHLSPIELEMSDIIEDNQQANFNVVQYQSFLCSSLYLNRDYVEAINQCHQGVQFCNNFIQQAEQNIQLEQLKPEAQRQITEFKSMIIKSEANLKNISALDLIEESKVAVNEANTKANAKTDYQYIGSNLAVYVLFTGVTLAGFLAFSRLKQN